MTTMEFTFELPTDSVEFFGGNDLLAVGMYKLEEDNSTRQGRIAFIGREEGTWKRREEAVQLNGGLLDMKWSSQVLLAATSNDVCLASPQRGILQAVDLKEGLNLCVDIKDNEDCLVSTSNGRVFYLEQEGLREKENWKAHEMETWCVSALDENLVATGADDFMLKIWDLRVLNGSVMSSKVHQAGVCSVVPLDGNVIATGSYDKQLRFLDLRNLRQPLSSISFASGVWRIKRRKEKLLLGCMHDGFHIVDLAKNWCEGKDARKVWHQPSGSLAYGCSWDEKGEWVAGASFYDCKVTIANLNS